VYRLLQIRDKPHLNLLWTCAFELTTGTNRQTDRQTDRVTE